MFLRKVLSFAGLDPSEKAAENSAFTAYNTFYNKTRVTEFHYKSEEQFSSAAIMHSIKHFNVLRTIRIDPKNRKITTEQVVPFRTVFSRADTVFNKHCAYALAKAIFFLHTEHNIVHNNVSLEALFVTSNLNFVLGSFEKCSKGTRQGDLDGFERVLKDLGLRERTLGEVLDDTSCYSELFDNIEAFLFELPILDISSKEKKILALMEQKGILNSFFSDRVSEALVLELKKLRMKGSDEEPGMGRHKNLLIRSVLELSPKKNEVLSELFTILDPTVRMFLLENKDVNSMYNLSERAVESLLLGVKCREQALRQLTIDFVVSYYGKLTEKQRVCFVRYGRLVRDRESLRSICMLLEKNKGANPKINKEVCKFIEAFLPVEDLRQDVMQLVKVYYKVFEYKDVCNKIIPTMFELVRHKATQKDAFEVIDLLVQHLKANREDILDRSWRLSGLKTLLLQQKKPQIPKYGVVGGIHKKKACSKGNTDTEFIARISPDSNVVEGGMDKNSEEDWDYGW